VIGYGADLCFSSLCLFLLQSLPPSLPPPLTSITLIESSNPPCFPRCGEGANKACFVSDGRGLHLLLDD